MSSLPSGLDLVGDFVNTRDVLGDADEIGSPDRLAGWLRERGLPAGRPDSSDVARAQALREALRGLLLAHTGATVQAAAVAALNEVAAALPLRARAGADGTVGLEPAGEGVDAALGRVLAVVARAQADGTWERMKACAADDCRWAYYDRSRNRSRSWCDMASCGNRQKARTYRARHKA